jgi:dTDP-4-dehydrorhamnose 3,5-epimerase-like enzyme
LAIKWPIPEGQGLIISDKDRNNPPLKDALA